MTKTATKEAEPALFTMKDVTPAKGAAQKQEPEKKPAKAKKEASKAVAVAAPQRTPAKAAAAPMNMMAVLANAASDPKCEPAKMRELYAIHKEMAADQAKIEFVKDFMALQAENLHINAKGKIVIPPKDGRTGQSTPYAKFNDINNAIKPLLQKHGFTLSFETEPYPDGSRLVVKGLLAHKGGHERMTAFPLPAEVSGSKNNVQGWGSSMSYGKRYCTIALLNITSEAMEDEDKDGAQASQSNEPREGTVKTIANEKEQDRVPDQPKRLTLNQCESLTALMKNCKVSIENFCERYGIAAVIDLNPSMLQEAEKALRAHAKKNGIELPEPK